MNVLILGCGTIGTLVGDLLAADGHQVVGVRRQPSVAEPGFRIVAGDIADPAWWNRFAVISSAIMDAVDEPGTSAFFDAVLLAANPGLRRGRDNGLEPAVGLLSRHVPRARLVYTGSTAVYADAGGGDVDEDARVDHADPALAKHRGDFVSVALSAKEEPSLRRDQRHRLAVGRGGR